MPSERHAERLTMGLGAVLSVAEAVAQLPVADHRGRRWLEAHGLIRRLDGTPVVIWLDVVEALRKPAEAVPEPRPRLARVAL